MSQQSHAPDQFDTRDRPKTYTLTKWSTQKPRPSTLGAIRGHKNIAGDEKLDREMLSVLAGLCFRREGDLANPFIKSGFTIAVVSTNYELHCDLPLASSATHACDRAYHKGVNGATSGRERARRKRRASHDSRYPMEQVKRIDRPTTLILDDEVPRVPKRAAFFERSLQGDLGEKSQRERARFSFKHPLGMSLLKVIRSMVRHQVHRSRFVRQDS